MAYEYFTEDSSYEVAAFRGRSSENFLTNLLFTDAPFHTLEAVFKLHHEGLRLFYNTIRTKLNRPRTEKYLAAKQMGYKLVFIYQYKFIFGIALKLERIAYP